MVCEASRVAIDHDLEELKSYFHRGTIFVHERKSSCLGFSLPLVMVAYVRACRCVFRRGYDSETPGRYNLEVDMEFVTLSHGSSQRLPVITFSRGLLEYFQSGMTNPGVTIFDFCNQLRAAMEASQYIHEALPKTFDLVIDERVQGVKDQVFSFYPITKSQLRAMRSRQARIGKILRQCKNQ